MEEHHWIDLFEEITEACAKRWVAAGWLELVEIDPPDDATPNRTDYHYSITSVWQLNGPEAPYNF